MHFFSPVHKMPLLEVIVTPRDRAEATVTAVAYGKQLGKTVIVVNDGPGFYTTRMLSAYMNEAGRLLDEGATIEAIDEALVEFGFPVGPITLLDEVGIDVGGKVGPVLSEAFGPRMTPSDVDASRRRRGADGPQGRKGFYRYDADGKEGRRRRRRSTTVIGGAASRRCRRRDRRALRAGDGQRGGALPRGRAFCARRATATSARCSVSASRPSAAARSVTWTASVPSRIVEQLEDLNVRFPQRFEPAEGSGRHGDRGRKLLLRLAVE